MRFAIEHTPEKRRSRLIWPSSTGARNRVSLIYFSNVKTVESLNVFRIHDSSIEMKELVFGLLSIHFIVHLFLNLYRYAGI